MAEELTFQHLETNEDVFQHLELMRNVFGQDSRVDLMVQKLIGHHPTMTLNDFFVIKHKNKMVAALENLRPIPRVLEAVVLRSLRTSEEKEFVEATNAGYGF